MSLPTVAKRIFWWRIFSENNSKSTVFYVFFLENNTKFCVISCVLCIMHFCCKLLNVANYALFASKIAVTYFFKKKYQACMFYHLLCRVCLLCLPAFRALVTKTWSTCKNLSQSKPLKSIKHNSIPH